MTDFTEELLQIFLSSLTALRNGEPQRNSR